MKTIIEIQVHAVLPRFFSEEAFRQYLEDKVWEFAPELHEQGFTALFVQANERTP